MNSYELQCFRDEFELLQKINHPNVVRVFALREDAQAVYLIMEHLNGSTLSALIEQALLESGGKGLHEDQAVDIFAK